jgi:hypothetical protein
MLEDPLFWLLVLPGLLLGAYAQWQIKANVAKYSQLGTKDGITGAEVARKLLDSGGLQAVSVEATPGMLTDHYDPRSKILRLSQDAYFTPSVAAAGIAAHEAGCAARCRGLPPNGGTELYRAGPAAGVKDRPLVVCRGIDVAAFIPDLGWSHPIRVVLLVCFSNIAG